MTESNVRNTLTTAEKNRRLLWRLTAIVPLMFAFAVFVMPPLYEAFCELTGLNGKTSMTAASTDGAVVDDSRQLKVEFLVATDKALPWDFRYETPALRVHPGEIAKTTFFVKNRDSVAISGRAIPSVSPAEAAQYLKKTECFCFDEQRLEGGAEAAMPMIFYVDPAIPKHLTTITLSYRFYNMTGQARTAAR